MASRVLKTTAEWRALARFDALYVVATWPGKQGAWTEAEFYAVGQSDWADFKRHWQHYWPELGGTCLEIGCGAGRITHALAEDFERVVALDVSADMIDLARAVSPGHVEFRQVDGTEIPLEDASVDGVFTCHVLQHLDGLRPVADYLAEARRVLRPGGSLMVQLGLHSAPMPLWARAREEVRLWRSRRARANGSVDLNCRVKLYRREEILATLEPLGFGGIELRVFPVRSNGAPHAFWLARCG